MEWTGTQHSGPPSSHIGGFYTWGNWAERERGEGGIEADWDKESTEDGEQ